MKLKISALTLAVALAASVQAQELQTSYFMETSTTRHESNPALLDGAYVTMPLTMGYLNLGTRGNAGMSDFVFKMKPSWQNYGQGGNMLTTFMHPDVDAGAFLNGLKDKTRIGLELKYQLAGVAFKAFGGMNVVELNLRSNTNVTLPKTLFDFMKTAGDKSDYQISDMGVRTENMMELGLGHARSINDQWRVGGKMKLLFGLAYADMNVEKLNIHMQDDYWKVDGDVQVAAALMKTDFEYEGPDKNFVDANGQVTERRRVKGLDDFKGGLSGFGLAFDLGATYKPIDDLTVSAALTDLGFVSWSNVRHASSAGTWTFDGFKNPIYCGGTDTGNNKIDDQLDAIGDDLENLFSVYEDPNPKKGDTRALAATLNLGAEYTLPVYRNLRFGFLYSGRFAGQFSRHQAMLSANVRPVRWFEASWSVAAGTTGVTSGLLLDFRAPHFNFFIGTDRFFGKLGKQGVPLNNLNANLSLGMSFPLGKATAKNRK